jgi:hypothetical protein
MAFPFLTIFLVFLICLAIRYKKVNQDQQNMQEDFWKREAAANTVPPVDLDHLTYITIPLDRFPIGQFPDDDIAALEQQLQQLAGQRILNVTGQTNTQLKETYGVSNLEKIQLYGENFDRLTLVLKDYGEALIQKECIPEAVRVLEFGVAIKTDVSQDYLLLGQCYRRMGRRDKICDLMDQVSALSLVLSPSILRHLQDMVDEMDAK